MSAIIGVAFIGLAGCTGPTIREDNQTLLGQEMRFSAPKLDGTRFQSESFKGKVVLVDFWASWCAPCRRSMPYYKDLYARHHDRGFEIVGVSVDDDLETAKRFADEYDVPFPMVWDSNKTIVSSVDISTMPTAFVINKAGLIAYTHEGFNDESKVKLERVILSVIENQ
ncbi:MAG: TlpA family protein disulfide reductase [Deltaproteobacteria bacterium]|nr:TlpA family protein disulfide reductase [Deltaproteobacteria bacterium]